MPLAGVQGRGSQSGPDRPMDGLARPLSVRGKRRLSLGRIKYCLRKTGFSGESLQELMS